MNVNVIYNESFMGTREVSCNRRKFLSSVVSITVHPLSKLWHAKLYLRTISDGIRISVQFLELAQWSVTNLSSQLCEQKTILFVVSTL